MKHLKTLSCLIGMLLMSGCSNSVESQVKKACREGGGNRAACSCLYEQMAGYYGKDQFESIVKGQRQLPTDYNDKVEQAMYHCAAQQR